MNNRSKSNIGESIAATIKNTCYMLTILFTTLRACETILWPWYIVMSPLFIYWAIVIICSVAVMFID